MFQTTGQKRIFVPIKLHSKVWVSPLPMAGALLPHWVQSPLICFSEGESKTSNSASLALLCSFYVSNFFNGEIRGEKHIM